ncbi:MAG TPA: type I DNA topoisomerase [Candidatus Polarisedimenticolia bacterium]|nr:type I DNA topoisomerase [Candidatus Polarisedimenticolia bacterium]
MGKSLVIVESPAKAKTINKFLGRNFTVKASMGHVRDLPKRNLGVDEKHDFKPTYEVLPGRKKVIDELKKAAQGAEKVYLAPDPDREGEAICWHLAELLKKTNKNLHRVMFNEITKRAVQAGIDNPHKIDANRVDAQQARRILDRLVGYKISPLLWDKVRRGLSAGRVQSVALRMVVEREREIQAFVPEEYWTLGAHLEGATPPPFEARLIKVDDKKAELKSKEETDAVLAFLQDASFTVQSVESKEKKKNPVPPFITSKLQQDASRKLGFTVKKTMTLAQRLYEGMELGDTIGTVGLITYMRTDSTRIAPEALQEVRDHIARVHGPEYLPDEPRQYRTGKMAQEAHEAIRPTSMELSPDAVKQYLQKDEFLLYSLIWNRFVASQMKSAVFDVTSADIKANRALFRATGSTLKFAGWLAVYQEVVDRERAERERAIRERQDPGSTAEEDETARLLPPLEVGMALALKKLDPKQHFTQPPPRFTEASLVKELEENGIGRPSTYATILATLQNREYVEKTEGKFVPSELGLTVTDLLVSHFGDIVDVGYTAKMEEELDEIEEGRLDYVAALKDFNKQFTKDLKAATKNMENIKTKEEPTDRVCEKCGKPMVIKWGRYGRFLACTGYPECKNTQELASVLSSGAASAAGGGAGTNGVAEAAAPVIPEDHGTCEKCGSPMVLRRGRFGPFLACSAYPGCRNTKKIALDKEGRITVTKKPDRILDEPCPQCGKPLAVKDGRFGEFTACSNYPECKYIKLKEVGLDCPREGCGGKIVERRSRRGRTFFGCNNYPKCDFVTWYRPIAESCPSCGRPYTLEKVTKREGTTRFCDSEGCGYKKAVNS